MASKDKTQLERAIKSLNTAIENEYRSTENIERGGDRIRIPEHISLADAGEYLTNLHVSMEENIEVNFTIQDVHPNDALFCFYNGVNDIFGRLSATDTSNFKGGGEAGRNHPVKTDYNKTENFPIGNVSLPGLPISMKIKIVNNLPTLKGVALEATFECKRKYEPLVNRIINSVNEHVRSNSLFRHKAFNSDWEFINVRSFDPETITYSRVEERLLSANLFTPITRRQQAKDLGIPIKRGVLLHGSYGTGKTLTALYAARLCVENGWTFIQVRDTADIAHFLEQAKRLQPAVVFFEDVDTVTAGSRDQNLNAILNAVDGILSKDSEVMVVLTTNHVENISRAMLRPGRLDAIIELGALDAERTALMVRKAFARGKDKRVKLTTEEPDLESIRIAAEGYPPAFVFEATTKSRLYALEAVNFADNAEIVVSWDDVITALHELRGQYMLMQEKQAKPPESLTTAFTTLVRSTVIESLSDNEVVEPVGKAIYASIKRA